MKLCIFSPMILPVPAINGGAVEGLIELIAKVNEIEKKFDLTIVSIHDKKAVEISKSYHYTKFIFIKCDSIIDKILSKKLFLYINKVWIRFRGSTLISTPYVKKAWNKIKKENFDFYMIEGGGNYYNFGYLSKKIPKEKFGIHFHGEVAGDNALYKWFNIYMVVSNYIGRKLICNGILNSNKVHLLRNCFDSNSSRVSVDKLTIRNKFNFKENDFIFVFWGRLIPEKGVKELILAYLELIKIYKVKLLIVGNANFGLQTTDEYSQTLESLATEETKKGNIVFTGHVSHNMIGNILNACDVGVIPSIWDDPAPLTVYEGLSVGLPLIVTNTGGITEIAKNYENALVLSWSENFIYDLKNAMIELIKNNDLREKLSNTAKYEIKEYNENRYYENYYQLLINQKGCDLVK